MSPSTALKNVLVSLLLLLTAIVWSFTAMVWYDRFIPPFDRLASLLMPWHDLNRIPVDAGLGDRLAIMQGILDASRHIAHYTFTATIVSLVLVVASLTIVYQQKQRRGRENRLLLVKNREIARRNEFIRYLSATIGHEFKNTLGRIKRRFDLVPEIPRDARERIDDNFSKLFADIEIFKRISDDRESGLSEFTRVDLRQLLDEVSRHYAGLAEISVHETVPLPAIYASMPLLRTVFENVLDNAVKYRKTDQRVARVLIRSSLDRDGNRPYVTVSLRDEGIGMDDQQADQCFYRGRGSGDGWGQGLYFAKYVVGLHAGKIRVGRDYTGPGIGTEIIIKLPFVEEALDV
jgi:two-component system sensor kinase FixL